MRVLATLALAAALLSGCASVPEPVQNADQLKATHGFVRVTLPFGDSQYRPVLQALNGGAQHELKRNEALGSNVFGLWLPAGSYEFPELANTDGSKYLAVQVKAGQMTELGALVPIQLGGYEFITLPIRHAEVDADSARALAQLSPHLSNRQPLDWRPAAPPKPGKITTPPSGLGLIADLLSDYERHLNKPALNKRLKEQTSIDEMYLLALTALPPQAEEPAVDDKGNLYFGADLGQVRKRARDGSWTSLDTGTLQSITAVAAHGTRLLAGTQRGAILASDDGGKTWRQTAATKGGEAVLGMDRVGATWIVSTAKLTLHPLFGFHMPGQLDILMTTSDDLGGLVLSKQVKVLSAVPMNQSRSFKTKVWGNGYYVNALNEAWRLDAPSMQWSPIKLPHNASTFNVAANGTLTATVIQGAFSKLSVSTDSGATWLRRDTPSYPIYDVDFSSATAGLATRWNTGLFTSSIEFMRYDAAKDSWIKTHDAPGGCVKILRDAAWAQRYCLSSGGSILNHVDGKWVVEFAAN